MMLRIFQYAFMGFVLLAQNLYASDEGAKDIIIGTAGQLGVYYPAGGGICRLINRTTKQHGLHCTVEPTSGSIYNINAVRNQTLDIAFVQSDSQYHAYHGNEEFARTPPFQEMRSLFSLHTEAFTILVGKASAIKKFEDIKGKRLGVGNNKSGMLVTANEVIKAHGWTKKSFATITEYAPDELGKALCAGEVDVIMFAAGHPNGETQATTLRCKTRLIPIEDQDIDAMLQQQPYYSKFTIPGGMYAGNPDAIPTFGLKATVVTSSAAETDMIYQVVKAVFSNLEYFKTLHPVFSTLDKPYMRYEGLTAPLHPGAIRYYKEVGLMPK